MKIENPLFIIPKENNRVDKKTGGGNPPKYIGDKGTFEKLKRERVKEMDRIIEDLGKKKSIIESPGEKIFYEVEFHKEALSKSAQPRHLFDVNNIDVYAQVSENSFLAASSEENFKSFRNSVSKLDLTLNKNESAYLSAILKIKNISKEEKLISEVEKGKKFRGYLFVSDILSAEDGKTISEKISNKTKSDCEFFISESGAKVIYGNFESRFIDEISEPDPKSPIVKIEKSIDFVMPQSLSVDYPIEKISIEEPSLNARVGVLDSGIVDHDIYKKLIIGSEDFIGDTNNEDLTHGTFVGTRVMFGNDIERQIMEDKILKAKAKVLDIKVMKKNGGASDNEILGALKSVIKNKKYADIKIYNMSLNKRGDDSIKNGKKSFFTRELDALAHKHHVCFIISAGNHDFRNMQYPACLLEESALIQPPADMINGFSVGSIADTESSRSVALNNEPSPFTRTGLMGHKKPDMVHFGGNCDSYASAAGVGVKGFSVENGKISENIGTSFAAPLVSQVAAQIYAHLNENSEEKKYIMDLTKALLLHSGNYNLPAGSMVDTKDLSRIIGFGIPDFNRALDCSRSTATFVYCDSIGKIDKSTKNNVKITKHKIRFDVPNQLVGHGKKVKVKGTLVYTPAISQSGEVDYSLVDIDCNLHYLNSNGKQVSGALKKNNEDNRLKWNPTKSFEKIYTAYEGGQWEIWLTLTTRGAIENEEYIQDYALIISVEDVTSDMDKRVDLYNIIRQEYKNYNLVGVRNKVRIEQ